MGCLVALLIALVYYALSFFGTALAVWVVCWAFGFAFSWKIAIGIWFVLAILRTVFNVTVKKE